MRKARTLFFFIASNFSLLTFHLFTGGMDERTGREGCCYAIQSTPRDYWMPDLPEWHSTQLDGFQHTRLNKNDQRVIDDIRLNTELTY